MKATFLCELASYVGLHVEVLENQAQMHGEAFHCPSLVPILGQHYFHYAVDQDPQWLHDIPSHFRSKKHPIFKAFDRVAKSLNEGGPSSLVLCLQTPLGLFAIYRARGYDGAGAAFLHKDESGFGYIVEPFDTWIEERTRWWRSQWGQA